MTTTMPLSTANWHWKNKNVTPWAKSWFERELVSIEIKGEGDGVVSITDVTDVDGDVELGQRKSKVISIYDCKIDLKWKGVASDGTEVKGKLTVPEVSHEITLDGLSDYVYDWSLSSESSAAADKLFALAKARLPSALEAKFAEFPTVLVETHAKDIQIGISPAASAGASRTGTPAPAGASASASTPPTKAVKQEKKLLTTKSVTVESTFMASADDLFQMLTDESKIPMWTRAAAQSKPEPGEAFSLFGGGVKGSYLSLNRPGEFVQKWALSSPTWPSDHTGILTATLEQSSDSTKLILRLDGVPTGLENEIRRNLEGYYIQGLKSIGYVQLVYSEPSSSYTRPRPRRQTQPPFNRSTKYLGNGAFAAVTLAVLVLLGAFVVPLFQS